MSVSSTTTKVSYSGDGSTAAFSYTFKIFADADLQVIIQSSAGAETIKTLTTHYTVSGAGEEAGGTVTFTSGNIPASGETVVIRRNLTLTQSTDYVENDPFPAESHEDALDRLTFISQGTNEELDRAIKAPVTDPTSVNMTLPVKADRLGKLLGFDATTGDPEATTGRVLSATATDVSPGGSATASFNDTTGVLTIGVPTGATGAAGAGLDVLTTRGDIAYRNASNETARLGAGSANTVLKSDGTDIAYGQVATAMIADDAVSSAKIADSAVVTAAIADDAVTLAKMASGTDGNLITYDASGNPAHVATGSSGQVLTSNGAGAAPTFQAAAGGGKVLQIVQASTQTQVNSTSSSYADTNVTATITPSATSSKVLVLVSQALASAAGAAGGEVAIVRGSTTIEEFSQLSNVENQMTNHYLPYLDSPSTTAATTYKTQFKRIDQSGTLQAQRNDASGNATSIITLIEIGA